MSDKPRELWAAVLTAECTRSQKLVEALKAQRNFKSLGDDSANLTLILEIARKALAEYESELHVTSVHSARDEWDKDTPTESSAHTYWNHGDEPIVISLGIVADPFGGPGRGKQTIMLEKGAGINLSMTPLKPYKLASTIKSGDET